MKWKNLLRIAILLIILGVDIYEIISDFQELKESNLTPKLRALNHCLIFVEIFTFILIIPSIVLFMLVEIGEMLEVRSR